MLNIAGDFEKHAKRLLEAVDEGRSTHGTANIAESGKPLEQACRALFSNSLPETFNVVPGYFFNSEMDLSPQVDVLICDKSDMLQLSPAASLEQRYLPYSCVQVIIQVKNGAAQLEDALAQSARAVNDWRRMDEVDHEYGSDLGRLHEPLSIVVIGKGGDQAGVEKALKRAPAPFPGYLLLIESGLMYGPDLALFDVFDYGPSDVVKAVHSGENGRGCPR